MFSEDNRGKGIIVETKEDKEKGTKCVSIMSGGTKIVSERQARRFVQERQDARAGPVMRERSARYLARVAFAVGGTHLTAFKGGKSAKRFKTPRQKQPPQKSTVVSMVSTSPAAVAPPTSLDEQIVQNSEITALLRAKPEVNINGRNLADLGFSRGWPKVNRFSSTSIAAT